MNSEHLDSLDEQILMELKQNCRRSYRELASATGMSPATLIERIRKLEQKGIITGYSANIDHLKIGFEFIALVQLDIQGDLLRIQEKVGKMKGVAAVYDTTGQYDSAVLLLCKSRGELSSLVKKILAVPGIQKTNTSMILNIVKKVSEFDQI